jgi:hypothetical protein
MTILQMVLFLFILGRALRASEEPVRERSRRRSDREAGN